MKTQPIIPARLQWNADAVPFSSEFGDVYHPASGALEQVRHVFLAGNDLPARWAGRERFVVLETGFGLGNNFLATWDAWRHSAPAKAQLHFISIEQHPLTREDLVRVHRDSALAPLAEQLVAAWPPLTPNLHRLSFEGGRVQLLLALGDAVAWLPELVARVDAYFLDGFAPSKNPQLWQPRIFKALARLAAPGATAATWTAARAVREGLSAAGFQVSLGAGQGGKRDITLARYAPAFTPRRAPSRLAAPASESRRAIVIGAGLAGCAAAWALAEQGWSSTVLDRHDAPAREASGNPGGLFHGIVNPQDGAHARFNRAAALQASIAVREAIARHGARGGVDGLLRLETSGADADAMRATLSRLGLPPDYVQALDRSAASVACGMPISHPAWFYPGGGWVQPAALAASFLARAGRWASFRAHTAVDALRRVNERWQLLDVCGEVIDESEVVVLANAGDALRLLGHPGWPVEKLRGQISLLPASPRLPLPRIPLAGAGYLLPAVDGLAVFGATSQRDDDDAAVRLSDHVDNLRQLARLTGAEPDVRIDALQGRTGWRWASDDRLPIIGAVPRLDGHPPRLDQPRMVPRMPGLFVLTALGSRGIGWSALAAQTLASAITGAPSPLEASLLDAVDPARFVVRAYRSSQARSSA
ncbi:MAG TPA: bifunctional tRNA (5-methylaminomethyl-2-thiouridine)(34)-methyltransferase MnmD/FAD-dependent 5-carboxymethylaminomethyl-2-thiouridine(34) oxidoreductase MnmC [Albitalea sp.]|nr:bifunctional tRNA (5-methylaminomethyl-2-thiouridine)(34)-methyltransferase MnmD/FAD-dependent 5-carboxymethylaminomethyl-2-thiouridine(34) oxidoreductase MnmC [Albitalea sp.]